MDMPNWADLVSFHTDAHAVFLDRFFTFDYTGDSDSPKAGFTLEAVKTFPSNLAKMGVAW